VHLADGTCLGEDALSAACVEALAALGQGDQRAAHGILVRLAAARNLRAWWHLGALYDEGGYVQCNALIACALFCAATGWQVLAGAFAAPADAADAKRQDLARAYRERLGPAISAAADSLMLRLLAPDAFEAALREAGGERDAQFAAALADIDRGEPAAAAARLAPMAVRGHAHAQRALVRLWAEGTPADDPVHEIDWTRAAAQAGDEVAMARLAAWHEEGQRLPLDLTQAARQNDGEALQQLGRVLAGGLGVRRDPVAAQALFVLAGRYGSPQPAFFGAGEADPRAVRRLLERIDAGADLVEVLGLAQLPASRADTSAGADAPAAAPSIRPAFRRESDEAVLARFEADRRARQAACAAAIRAALPAIVASLALVACLLHFLDRMPGALPEVLWLTASGLAAWAVARVNRARGVTRKRLAHAAVMFTPVFGQMFAALWLYRSWRQLQ
jgi:TPR repeat protein